MVVIPFLVSFGVIPPAREKISLKPRPFISYFVLGLLIISAIYRIYAEKKTKERNDESQKGLIAKVDSVYDRLQKKDSIIETLADSQQRLLQRAESTSDLIKKLTQSNIDAVLRDQANKLIQQFKVEQSKEKASLANELKNEIDFNLRIISYLETSGEAMKHNNEIPSVRFEYDSCIKSKAIITDKATKDGLMEAIVTMKAANNKMDVMGSMGDIYDMPKYNAYMQLKAGNLDNLIEFIKGIKTNLLFVKANVSQ